MGKFLFNSVRKLFFSENACFEHNTSCFLLVWFCVTHYTTVIARDLETAHLHIGQEAKSLESAFIREAFVCFASRGKR